MKNWFCLLIVLLPLASAGQECLFLLDSATAYQKRDQIKAREILEELVLRLDSGRCDVQIGYAEAYNNAGLIYWKLDDQRAAIGLLQRATLVKLEQFDSLAIEMLPFYDNLYAIYRDYGKYEKAGKYLDLADKTLSNHTEEGITYLNHLIKSGVFYKEIGLLDKSTTMLSKAKMLTDKKAWSDSIVGSILIESGSLFTLKGEYQPANEDLNRAILILRSNYPILHARAVDRLAKLLMETGELAKSESSLLSNIGFKKDHFPDDTLLLVESLNNLGVLYYRINDIEKSRIYFDQLISMGKDYPEVKPFGLNNLGVIYLKEGDVEKAVTYFEEACYYFATTFGTLHQEYANVLNNLAGARNKLGETDIALSLYNQVLDLDKSLFGENHPKYATSLTNLAHIYAQLGYLEVAEKFIRTSTLIKQKTLGSSHHEVAKSLNDLGLMELILGDTTKALQSFDSALYINIHHIQNIFPVLTDGQRNLAYEQIKYSLRRFSSLAFSNKYFDSKWSEKALNYTINTKSILFYASDKMRRLTQESKDPEIKNLYNRWRRYGIELANAYLMAGHEREVQKVSIKDLENKYHELEKLLAQRVSAFSNQTETTFVNWNQISNSLTDSSALVEMVQFRPYEVQVDSTGIVQGFTDESHYACFVIKPGEELEKVDWSKETNFEKSFSFFRNALKYSVQDEKSYQALWSPIDVHLKGVRKVFFAGDGDWHKLNPAIFYDTLSHEFVTDKYEILYVTSGKDLITRKSNNWDRTAYVLGNPDFNIHAEMKLNSLEGAEEEAKEVSGILKKDKWKTETLINKKATEESIKMLHYPGILHIATHGYFNEDETSHPLLNSGLYLTADGVGEDGKLTAYEAMNLTLDRTLLVVLSACETGLGKVDNGEGVFGLQRSFLAAGAENLIITLVKIDDAATQYFMKLFYENFVGSENVELAFFKTRQEFKKKFTDPLDWGAFVLISKH